MTKTHFQERGKDKCRLTRAALDRKRSGQASLLREEVRETMKTEDKFEADELLQEEREKLSKMPEQEVLFDTDVKKLGLEPQRILKEKGEVVQYVVHLSEGGMDWCTVLAKLKTGRYYCFGGAALRPTEEYYEGDDMEQAIQAFIHSTDWMTGRNTVKYNITSIVFRGEIENEKNYEIEADNTSDALGKFLKKLDFGELSGDSVSIHISRKEVKKDEKV